MWWASPPIGEAGRDSAGYSFTCRAPAAT
jgi:hypothetical protein